MYTYCYFLSFSIFTQQSILFAYRPTYTNRLKSKKETNYTENTRRVASNLRTITLILHADHVSQLSKQKQKQQQQPTKVHNMKNSGNLNILSACPTNTKLQIAQPLYSFLTKQQNPTSTKQKLFFFSLLLLNL